MARKPKNAPAGDGEAEGQDGAAPAGGSKKKLIVIGAAVLLVAGAGGGGFMVMRSRAAHAEKPAAEQKLPVAFMDVREMSMNLMPEPGQTQPRFVRLKVALEVRDSKVAAEIQPLMPRVEDTFQVFVRELRVGDFEAAGGTYRLREELLRRVNVAVYPAKVDAVLFKDFIIQ
ncbi:MULTISPECIES: flagellar basal body-associated protein FliL [Methylobacterium]|mgnify:CR=1 FL=1|jgi:flagellar FliL protein|uniref:Flagellar protein FliL n=2 Tax=Methylobacterium TaxID=407 RepID=A0A0C6FC62_9HYPH|nr:MULTISPECIES: flagellar basal body-associated protein FliL [Methylobacterium]MBK3399916.1 flagellar basal body-associated protein FliL [Methylobacterium ajmalii]MBK3411830.1 flagellar basal body-associated protein FliL [Methylobacterium ajmalii]MBK3424566.1 flagellar basal body-associated protein FliL [Methylobacterium ajmalii]MBZ6414680.1 flagellar basal body-associated protein FliL [Methylobacterium sp.]SFF65151.1 flagellar FliL protein [Methylobacterium sp. yr596]